MNTTGYDNDSAAQHFLDIIRQQRRGRLKIYIGMIAGVGKTFRMLKDAHQMQRQGIDVQIAYIETHKRRDTESLVEGLTVIPRRQLYYKGRQMEEMDTDNVILIHPEVAIVDELAHTNLPGSKNDKRWQDVEQLLEAGISVITAVNIQHIESLSEEVGIQSGIEVRELVPDSLLQEADEVVNIDLTADELIQRLKDGKIYSKEKIENALDHFFKTENILRLRSLALGEVALRVSNKAINESGDSHNALLKSHAVLACISSNALTPRHIIRRAARIAAQRNSTFCTLYVRRPSESPDRVNLASQRHLMNHFQLTVELGGEVIQAASSNVIKEIEDVCTQRHITTVCIGQPAFKMPSTITKIRKYRKFLDFLAQKRIDLIILA